MIVFFEIFKNIISFILLIICPEYSGRPKLLIFCYFSSGFPIFCYHYEILEMTFENSFLLFIISALMQFREENYRKLYQRKREIQLPKNVKFHFCLPFRLINTILSTNSLQHLCMKIMWPRADFCSGDIYITMLFQVKN